MNKKILFLSALRILTSKVVFTIFAIGGLAGFNIGCSSDGKNSDAAEGAYAIAQEFDKDERYEEAIKRYQEVKNKFPYSKYATMSELSLADVYYKQESFAEAQVAYQSFKDLHPKHAQIDYVSFRIGMSYFKQLPETIDRDLSLANNAIAAFDEVLSKYSQSTYVQESKDNRLSALKMLAGKEEYIAEFYFKREKFDSALTRFEGLLASYPGLGFDAIALSKAVICAHKTGDFDKRQRLLKKLEAQFPGSNELDAAQKGVR